MYQSVRKSFVEAETSTFDKSNFYTQTSFSFVQVEGPEVQIIGSGVRLQVKFWLSFCWSCNVNKLLNLSQSCFSSVKWG